MKQKFLSQYTIKNMNKNSLTVENNATHEMCFIHRNAFNQLDNATDFRETNKVFVSGGVEKETKWIEILVWKTLQSFVLDLYLLTFLGIWVCPSLAQMLFIIM